jgi:hypothetical protein
MPRMCVCEALGPRLYTEQVKLQRPGSAADNSLPDPPAMAAGKLQQALSVRGILDSACELPIIENRSPHRIMTRARQR